MNIFKRIFRNSTYVFISNLFTSITAFVISVYLTRYLGLEGFGKFSFVVAFIYFFTMFSHFNLDMILVRELSIYPKKRDQLVNNVMTLKTLLSLSAMIIAVGIISFMPYPFEIKMGVLVRSLVLIFISYTLTLTTIFQAKLEMIFPTIANIVSRSLFALFIVVLIVIKAGLIPIIAVSTFSFFVETLLILIFSKKYINFRFEFDKVLCKHLLIEAFPLALVGIFYFIYLRIDVILLSLIKGVRSVGLYSAAYTITESLSIIPNSLMTSIFPLISSFIKTSVNAVRKSVKLTFKILIVISLPIAVGISIYSKRIIVLLYGIEFAPSATALSVLVWSTAFLFFNISLSLLFIAMGGQKKYAVISFLGAILNISLNLYLIRAFDFLGAAITMLITEAFIFTGLIIVVGRDKRNVLDIPYKTLFIACIGVLAMSIFSYTTNFHLLISVALLGIIYITVIMVLGIFEKSDINMIKDALFGK